MAKDIITAVIETIATYRRATTKPYQNIRHVMMEKEELLVPSDVEEYVFRLNEGWSIIYHSKYSITMKRKQNDGKEKVQIA